MVLDELPDAAYLPELPARGPGGDLIGRGAGLLVDLHVDLQPSGWRFVDRPGRDATRTRDLLSRDLDALADTAADYDGWFKVAVAGPWTLAAGVELHRGDKAVADAGACRDLAESLAAGVAEHLGTLARILPRAQVVLQLDEPSLPDVLRGGVPTASGFGKLEAVESHLVEDGLRTVLAAAATTTTAGSEPVPTVVHCCADQAPIELFRAAGASAVGLDLSSRFTEDDVGVAIESGTGLLVGVLPATDAALPDPQRTADRVRRWWQRLGFDVEKLPGALTLTPTCGLAGASPPYARAVLAHLRAAGDALTVG